MGTQKVDEEFKCEFCDVFRISCTVEGLTQMIQHFITDHPDEIMKVVTDRWK